MKTWLFTAITLITYRTYYCNDNNNESPPFSLIIIIFVLKVIFLYNFSYAFAKKQEIKTKNMSNQVKIGIRKFIQIRNVSLSFLSKRHHTEHNYLKAKCKKKKMEKW